MAADDFLKVQRDIEDERHFARQTFPIAIAQGRYHTAWFAIPSASLRFSEDGRCPMNEGLWDDDVEAFQWVEDNRARVGIGDTPRAAYDDLYEKVMGVDGER